MDGDGRRRSFREDEQDHFVNGYADRCQKGSAKQASRQAANLFGTPPGCTWFEGRAVTVRRQRQRGSSQSWNGTLALGGSGCKEEPRRAETNGGLQVAGASEMEGGEGGELRRDGKLVPGVRIAPEDDMKERGTRSRLRAGAGEKREL